MVLRANEALFRELMPGSSSAATLLLSEADQRMLLETARERSQMAMLGFALNGVAFSSEDPIYFPPSAVQPGSHYLPLLQTWALYCNADPTCVEDSLESMGRDFAAAVQLLS